MDACNKMCNRTTAIAVPCSSFATLQFVWHFRWRLFTSRDNLLHGAVIVARFSSSEYHWLLIEWRICQWKLATFETKLVRMNSRSSLSSHHERSPSGVRIHTFIIAIHCDYMQILGNQAGDFCFFFITMENFVVRKINFWCWPVWRDRRLSFQHSTIAESRFLAHVLGFHWISKSIWIGIVVSLRYDKMEPFENQWCKGHTTDNSFPQYTPLIFMKALANRIQIALNRKWHCIIISRVLHCKIGEIGNDCHLL